MRIKASAGSTNKPNYIMFGFTDEQVARFTMLANPSMWSEKLIEQLADKQKLQITQEEFDALPFKLCIKTIVLSGVRGQAMEQSMDYLFYKSYMSPLFRDIQNTPVLWLQCYDAQRNLCVVRSSEVMEWGLDL